MIEEFIKDLKEHKTTMNKDVITITIDKLNKLTEKHKQKLDKILKERDQEVVGIVLGCKLYRNAFILKKELVRKLKEAFPEK